METNLASRVRSLEQLPTLDDTGWPGCARKGNRISSPKIMLQPPARQAGHAYQDVDVTQPTPPPGPAIPATTYDLHRSLDVAAGPKSPLEPPQVHIADTRADTTPDHTPHRASDHLAGNQPQLFSLLEAPETNAELLDCRKHTIIPIVSGEHRPVSLDDCETLGIDASSLMVLCYLGLIEATLAAFDHVKFPSNIVSHLREQQDSVRSQYPTLVREADYILNVIDSAVRAGKASFVSASTGAAGQEACETPSDTVSLLIARANECDAICIDDPSYNRRNAIQTDDNREVPVACVLDLLCRLRDIDRIANVEYRFARHKLRQGGFAVVLPESDELHYWLKASTDDGGSVIECLELRTIRQSIGHFAQFSASSTGDIGALAIPAIESCTEAVTRLWADESVPLDEAADLSDWVWMHASPLSYCGKRLDAGLTSSTLKTIIIRVLAYLLAPKDLPESRQQRYSAWIEDAVLPVFRPANLDLIDSALDLVANTISAGEQYENIYNHSFLVRLPKSLGDRLLSRRPALGSQWGVEMRRWISFDSGPKVASKDFIAKARQAYLQDTPVSLPDEDERSASISINDESHAVLVAWTDTRGQRRTAELPQMALLSQFPAVRVVEARKVVELLGATAGDFRQFILDLELRTATDEEIDQIANELANGVKTSQDRLYHKIANNKPIDLDEIVPSDLAYFDKFVGHHRTELDVDQYIHEVVIPYRRELLNLDFASSLEIACLGFLRDDLAPGAWMSDVGNDELWDALERFNCTGSPIALLGALDITLHRQDDQRFREFATNAVKKLVDESFGRSDGFDTYSAFAAAMELVLNRINTLDSGSVQPGYWRRMGAWMQAGLFVGHLARCQPRPSSDRLQEFANQNRTIGGWLALCVDARHDALVLATRTVGGLLHAYVIERLLEVRWRHEELGHRVPELDCVDPSRWRSRGNPDESTLGLPGPLDGHRVPTEPLPREWSDAITRDLGPGTEGFPWNKLATLSQLHVLGEEHLEACRATVRQLGGANGCEMGVRNALRGMGYASYVASACRDASLADAIGDAITGIATRTAEPEHLRAMLGSLIQSAAAHHDELGDDSAWADWLEDKLVQVAERLPPPPSAASQAFRDNLDELGIVLPTDLWVHLRARAIVACIAPSSPTLEDQLPGGWLDESLSDLDEVYEAALAEGFDEPSETALRSSREFLKSLATAVHQSPDVAPMSDGTIGIDFRNQTGRGGVLFVVEPDGSGACYTLVNGVSKHFVRARCEDLLDDEIRTAVTAAGVG